MGHMQQLGFGFLAAIAAGIVLVAEHYFPYRRVLKRKLPRPAAYVLGVLALLVPFSIWGLLLGYVIPIIVVWLVAATGGATVLGCYALDKALNAGDAEESNKGLLDAIRREPGDRAD